ncbi:hypothetical protein SEA_BANTAM_92 [Gordonia phage Bantam]|uniref:Uncharacterized protein n=1 Tax=Gordonia phage Bantam TaxID=1887641 RepID=A0A1B3AYG6_9CAUD|nr:hypothetical protein BIZ77_gp087 [Gordonia phage Bantam]AOE43781.1 hypothetical protein SEA_BANTAM_92 [Gordonia phage Bantam]
MDASKTMLLTTHPYKAPGKVPPATEPPVVATSSQYSVRLPSGQIVNADERPSGADRWSDEWWTSDRNAAFDLLRDLIADAQRFGIQGYAPSLVRRVMHVSYGQPEVI